MNKTTALVFFGIILIGLVISLVTLNTCSKPIELGENNTEVPQPEDEDPAAKPDGEAGKGKGSDEAAETPEASGKSKGAKGGENAKGSKGEKGTSNQEASGEAGYSSPEAAMKALSAVVSSKDFEAFADLVGDKAIPKAHREKLKGLIEHPEVKLSPDKPFTEISKSADSVRWALNFESDDPGLGAEVYADLASGEGKSFKFTGIRLPIDLASTGDEASSAAKMKDPVTGEEVDAPVDPADRPDALAVAHAFSRAIVKRDFKLARALADTDSVTDERVAALMIAIEEGKFELKEDRPLVVTLSREDITWVLSRLQSAGGASEFAVELGQVNGEWKVNGLTFSKVLSALAQAAGGGDIAYSPIVEDPAGGDSLVLYFEFDEAGVTSRGNRQLAIVADILSQGTERVIRINGHADALGSDDYNANLSNQRATSIREALISMGVAPDQVVTEGFGETKPRRPNFNPDGTDNPTGRSENRRAEVYLDF